MTRGKWLLVSAMAVLLGGSGCGAVDRLLDCQKVCNKKKECINDSYDVNACVDYCRNRASNEEAYGQKLNDCSACFETRACVEAAACYAKGSCPQIP